MVEATADGATQLSATRRYTGNMAAAIYGLVLTGSIVAASTVEDSAGSVLGFLVLTLVLFWAAHVYAELLSHWATSGRFPGRQEVRGEMRNQWPIVGSATLPAAALLAGVLDLVRDGTAVNLALAISTAELALAGFLAARRGGGGRVACLASAAIAFAFGAALIILKALLH